VNKPVLAEAAIGITSGVVAASFADILADHNVNVFVTIAVVMFVLCTGITQGTAIAEALRTTLYRCPAKGCDVTIRAPKDVGQDALARYRQQATDHTNHAQTGTR
jgi:hypothetical protein